MKTTLLDAIGKTSSRLGHLSIPRTISYAHASRLQNILADRLLSSKSHPSSKPFPDPVILTAQFHPTYTCGRREVSHVSKSHVEYLRADGRAEFFECLRGGQTTYHGPGQMTSYPILDLKRFKLSPRCYIHLLEEAVIRTIAGYGLRGVRTENPGVWMPGGEKKICAVGVRLRRNVSSHGIGLNVKKEVMWGFNRIVACGLEGKEATSLEGEGVNGVNVEEVGNMFVGEMKKLLGVEETYRLQEQAVLALQAES
ncbi:MAG: hypothetical protein M1834_003384 [Cirrosporium novae-zelandiae]|nr:MAG: hypothetical protein M1834_003384 [Cirrosporium novae-zelandiae]